VLRTVCVSRQRSLWYLIVYDFCLRDLHRLSNSEDRPGRLLLQFIPLSENGKTEVDRTYDRLFVCGGGVHIQWRQSKNIVSKQGVHCVKRNINSYMGWRQIPSA
jgi:hypothetical protein